MEELCVTVFVLSLFSISLQNVNYKDSCNFCGVVKAHFSLPELRGTACNFSRSGWGVVRDMEKQSPSFGIDKNRSKEQRRKEKKVEEMNRKPSRPHTPGARMPAIN